jgi:hypothetical protein
MCNPAVAAFVTVAAVVASTAIGIRAQHQAAEQAEDNAELNANLARMRGKDEIAQGRSEIDDRRISVARAIGRAKASNVGIDSTQGTAALLLTETYVLGELDVRRIANNAERRAYGHELNALIGLYEGDVAAATARNNQIAIGISGFGSAVSAGYKAYSLASTATAAPIVETEPAGEEQSQGFSKPQKKVA